MDTNSRYKIKLEEGDVIFQEGDYADSAYIIEKGSVEVSTLQNKQPIILRTLGPGDILGEMAIIDEAERTATATACEPVQLMVISREQITQRIENADPIIRLLLHVLLERYRSGLQHVRGESSIDPSHYSDAGHEAPDATGLAKIRLESDLKDALENGGLQVVYQPMLNLKQRTITGFEALARWTHPKLGLISPVEFISLAEETDLIVPVGLHILEVAATQLAQFQSIVDYPLFMSINVSPRQMHDRGFLKFAAKLIKMAGLELDQIKLEVTETLAVDLKFLSGWIENAHKLGFRVALDDFGTGYTSLEYLSHLKANSIKIDQAFIIPLFEDDRHGMMLKHIVGMLRDLGFEVIAEGVETERHIEHLDKLGVHLAQGYGISKPAPAEVIKKFLLS